MRTAGARWAILGPGRISRDFAMGLRHAELGRLHAIGSREPHRARVFADSFGVSVSGSYQEIVGRDDVDAVYIGTVHTAHVGLVQQALAAGKAVLCEKPLSVSAAQTRALISQAEECGLPLVEAFKYRFGPFAVRLRELIAGGELGEITRIEAQLGFAAETRADRLFDPALAGGAILDAGCYPVSLAVGVAAWAGTAGDARVLSAEGVVGEVDEQASAEMGMGGIIATVRTAITQALPRAVVVHGSLGALEIPNVWGSRAASTETATLRHGDGAVEEVRVASINPMAAEADAVVQALREGRNEVVEMPWRDSITTAELLDQWRQALAAR